MAFRTGDRVHQRAYGVGDIIEINASYITITFDDGVTRKFAAARVQLEPSTAPRPMRSAPQPRRRQGRAPVSAEMPAKRTAS
jgi:hypothetical protein